MSYASMPPPSVCLFRNSLCARLPLSSLLHRHRTPSRWPRFCAVKIGTRGGRIGSQDAYGSDLLRKPIFSPPVKDFTPISVDEEEEEKEEEEEEKEKIERRLRYEQREEEEEFIDWENRILEDTVPLVGFVRMILHSGKYESGDRLIPKHERTILERLLPYHPESEKKIGCGIDYITIGYHPDFEASRCLFIVRKDGKLIDFSYWKCIKGLIRKNYPLYADGFILRHFRWRRHSG